jgi:CubicO group peptidase (beta-lactamase class C family)
VHSQDVLALSFPSADGETTSIRDFLGAACCDAFLVVHGGRVIAEHYFNGMTVRSHHLLNSITKSFIGMRAGIAIDRGRAVRGGLCRPGDRFPERIGGGRLASGAGHRQLRARLATLLETEIWSRLATRHDAAIVVDRVGFPYVGAGMNACARDLVHFGLMMMNDGVIDGRQVVPAAWIADTVNGDSTSKECFERAYGDFPGWHYRNQVWVASSEPAVMLAIGIHGQLIYMDKGLNLIIVMLRSQPQPFDMNLEPQTLAAVRAIGPWLQTADKRQAS